MSINTKSNKLKQVAEIPCKNNFASCGSCMVNVVNVCTRISLPFFSCIFSCVPSLSVAFYWWFVRNSLIYFSYHFSIQRHQVIFTIFLFHSFVVICLRSIRQSIDTINTSCKLLLMTADTEKNKRFLLKY